MFSINYHAKQLILVYISAYITNIHHYTAKFVPLKWTRYNALSPITQSRNLDPVHRVIARVPVYSLSVRI